MKEWYYSPRIWRLYAVLFPFPRDWRLFARREPDYSILWDIQVGPLRIVCEDANDEPDD